MRGMTGRRFNGCGVAFFILLHMTTVTVEVYKDNSQILPQDLLASTP